MHQILKSVTKSFNFDIHNIMSGRGRRGQSRTSAPEAPPERYVEHTLKSENASMNQPPAKPSSSADPGGGTLTMDKVIHIVISAKPLDTGASRIAKGHNRMCSKLGAKTYDSTGNPEAGYLWLDRVNVLAIIW